MRRRRSIAFTLLIRQAGRLKRTAKSLVVRHVNRIVWTTGRDPSRHREYFWRTVSLNKQRRNLRDAATFTKPWEIDGLRRIR